MPRILHRIVGLLWILAVVTDQTQAARAGARLSTPESRRLSRSCQVFEQQALEPFSVLGPTHSMLRLGEMIRSRCLRPLGRLVLAGRLKALPPVGAFWLQPIPKEIAEALRSGNEAAVEAEIQTLDAGLADSIEALVRELSGLSSVEVLRVLYDPMLALEKALTTLHLGLLDPPEDFTPGPEDNIHFVGSEKGEDRSLWDEVLSQPRRAKPSHFEIILNLAGGRRVGLIPKCSYQKLGDDQRGNELKEILMTHARGEMRNGSHAQTVLEQGIDVTNRAINDMLARIRTRDAAPVERLTETGFEMELKDRQALAEWLRQDGRREGGGKFILAFLEIRPRDKSRQNVRRKSLREEYDIERGDQITDKPARGLRRWKNNLEQIAETYFQGWPDWENNGRRLLTKANPAFIQWLTGVPDHGLPRARLEGARRMKALCDACINRPMLRLLLHRKTSGLSTDDLSAFAIHVLPPDEEQVLDPILMGAPEVSPLLHAVRYRDLVGDNSFLQHILFAEAPSFDDKKKPSPARVLLRGHTPLPSDRSGKKATRSAA
jgi:hypothetical protein